MTVNYFGEKNWKEQLELNEKTKEKSMINYIISPSGITVSYDGKLETISNADHRHNQVLEAIKDDRLEDIPNLIDVQKSFDNSPELELIDGIIHINGSPIEEELSDRVLDFKSKGLPYAPLLKFATKLQENLSYNTRQMLYKFLEHNGHPITKEGNFIAYKKVTTNFKDCHTGKIDNSVGTTVSMPRNQVDDNPNNTCSSGLHVAAYRYAKGFSSGHLVLVEVDPVDVVSVPVDYDGEKMRVCKYVVKEICESKLDDGIYEESDDSNQVFDSNGTELKVGDKVIDDHGDMATILNISEYDTVFVNYVDSKFNRVELDSDQVTLKRGE